MRHLIHSPFFQTRLGRWLKRILRPMYLILKKIKKNELEKTSPWVHFIWPPDWGRSGAHPLFYVHVDPSIDPISLRNLRVRIFLYHDFERESLKSKIYSEFSLEPSNKPGVLKKRLETYLNEGRYVAQIFDKVTAQIYATIGLHILTNAFDYNLYAAPRRQKRIHAKSPIFATEKIKFSITCTVYNTPPEFLEDLYACIFSQTYKNFEWLLLDNGSESEETMKWLASAAQRDSRIRLYRVEKNLHLIGGNRFLLERAQGDFIVPVDSDDYVYPEALAAFYQAINDNENVTVLFSDEEKVAPDLEPVESIIRAQWSTLSALCTCGAAHLMAYRRTSALETGVYSADYAKGCHDWDTSLRLDETQGLFIRVPEVLYGWRIHSNSTSFNSGVKDYILSSHMAALQESLTRRKLDQKFQIETTPFFGYYYPRRKPLEPRKIKVYLPFVQRSFSNADLQFLKKMRQSYPSAEFIILSPSPVSFAEGFSIQVVEQNNMVKYLNEEIKKNEGLAALLMDHLRPVNADWFWDALGTFDLSPQTSLVNGPILRNEAWEYAGYIKNLEGAWASPQYRDPIEKISPRLRGRRNISAVHLGAIVFDVQKIHQAGGFKGFDFQTGSFGIELSQRLSSRRELIAFAPLMQVQSQIPILQPERLPYFLPHELAEDDPYYPSPLSKTLKNFGFFENPEKEKVLAQNHERNL